MMAAAVVWFPAFFHPEIRRLTMDGLIAEAGRCYADVSHKNLSSKSFMILFVFKIKNLRTSVSVWRQFRLSFGLSHMSVSTEHRTQSEVSFG